MIHQATIANDVVVYREPEWCIVDMKDERGPWAVHYCFDKFVAMHRWHHVISAPEGKRNWPNMEYGACLECEKTAPDRLMTILELYR
jgi:hypothetical protein